MFYGFIGEQRRRTAVGHIEQGPNAFPEGSDDHAIAERRDPAYRLAGASAVENACVAAFDDDYRGRAGLDTHRGDASGCHRGGEAIALAARDCAALAPGVDALEVVKQGMVRPDLLLGGEHAVLG